MDSTNFILIGSILLCVALSAYFSGTETAFSSFNKIRMKSLAKGGDLKAARVLRLAEDYDKLLSTILIGNNIVNIASASIATIVFTGFFGSAGVSISTVVMTVLVLIFGEISPKSLAKETPERFAMASAPFLQVLMALLSPLNYLFGLWKRLLGKVFQAGEEASISEAELITLVEEAEQEGGIDAHESRLIRSAIEFNDLDAREILTARVDLVAVERSTPVAQVGETFASHGFSRLPVYDETIDRIVGVIHEKDFHHLLAAGALSIEPAIKPVIFTTPGAKISALLRRIQQSKSHLAVVVDEFGGTMGIVTLEDILEELVGEIWDEHDEVVRDIQELGEGRFLVSCSCDLDDFFERFSLAGDPEEEYGDVRTVSGWVMQELGHIPAVGEHFAYQNLEVGVVKTDFRRVLEIEVAVRSAREQEPVPA